MPNSYNDTGLPVILVSVKYFPYVEIQDNTERGIRLN